MPTAEELVTTAISLALEKLEQIERFLDAAESLIEQARALGQREDAIERALGWELDGNAEAEHLFDEALRHEAHAREEATSALQAAFEAGVADPWPPVDGAQELIALAGDALARTNLHAETVIEAADLADAADVAELSSTLGRLHQRHNRLRDITHRRH